MIETITTSFPMAVYGPPSTAESLAYVEQRLASALPSWLRQLYLAFDGFRGPGNAQYLFPLMESSDGGSTLLAMSEFMRAWDGPDFHSFLFFGSSTCDTLWGVDPSMPGRIIGYHHHMEDEVEVAGSDVLEVYLADADRFRRIAAPN